MKWYAITFFLLIFSITAFADEITIKTEGPSKKGKLLIIPFENNVDTNYFVNSEIIKSILFRSFYTFIGFIPSINVPEEGILTNITVDISNVIDIATNEDADIIIYGSYKFDGNKNNPVVTADLKAWTRDKLTNVFSKSYKTSTGVDIFDTIDEMIADVVKTTLNIEVNISTITFGDFRTGSEIYDLYINDKIMAKVTNSDFTYNLKVLPDTVYRVALKSLWNKTNALEAEVTLKKYKTINISHNAVGSVKINTLSLKDRWKTYSIYVDDIIVKERGILTNVQAGINHTLRVVDNHSNEVYKNSFYLHDGETKSYSPGEKSPGLFHAKLYSLDNSMAAFGLDVFLGRYFWFGAGSGASYVSLKNDNLYFISPFIETGYYLLGDMNYDFRLGIGLDAKVNIIYPDDVLKSNYPDVQNYQMNAGLFLSIEWKFIMIKPTGYMYFLNNKVGFSYGIGAGIKL